METHRQVWMFSFRTLQSPMCLTAGWIIAVCFDKLSSSLSKCELSWIMLLLALVLVISPYCGEAGEIWDPTCKYQSCLGDPIRGDGVSSFDTWNGNKGYQTSFSYNCTSGIGFDYTNFPAKLYATCGKKCTEWTYKNKGKTVKTGQCTASTAYDACYYGHSAATWVYSFTGGSLPACSKGECRETKVGGLFMVH